MPLEVKLIRHRGESRIGLFFEKNADLIARVKKVEGSKWSQSLKVWHIPDTLSNRTRFKVVVHEPSPEGYLQLEQFQRYLRSKRYSESTIKTYSEALKSFLTFYKEKSVYEITNDDVIIYNNSFILKNHLSSSYQNQIVNALKLYFTTQRGFKINIDQIHRPKREKTLPNVLSKEEVKQLLEAHSNIKHKTMLSLIYSCGLRRNELLQLKFSDIDSKRNIVTIKQGDRKSVV
jgi:integrase/recombinase XerD